MKIKYLKGSLRRDSIELINIANSVIEDYQSRGYNLTLRQLYYQLVARDFIPNTEKSYKRLGSIITKARDIGQVDWSSIVDRTRQTRSLPKWSSPAEILRMARDQFRLDKWKNQNYRIFVWVEKEALAGVIEAACTPENIQVDYLPCRGYMSASTIWREAQRIKRVFRGTLNNGVYENSQTPVILHLGDHDPSGIDMSRDNINRLELYSGLEEGNSFLFHRLALNYDQVEQYNPPPNPTKLTDTRAGSYINSYGSSSWELDALDPDALIELVQERILSYRNEDKWQEALDTENEQKEELNRIIEGLDK